MITVTATQSAKIYVKGTSIEISSVIARLEFLGLRDGKKIVVSPYFYENQAAYNNGNQTLSIDGVDLRTFQSKEFDLALGTNPETYALQTIQVAHDKIKEYLESLGYTVVISGI